MKLDPEAFERLLHYVPEHGDELDCHALYAHQSTHTEAWPPTFSGPNVVLNTADMARIFAAKINEERRSAERLL